VMRLARSSTLAWLAVTASSLAHVRPVQPHLDPGRVAAPQPPRHPVGAGEDRRPAVRGARDRGVRRQPRHGRRRRRPGGTGAPADCCPAGRRAGSSPQSATPSTTPRRSGPCTWTSSADRPSAATVRGLPRPGEGRLPGHRTARGPPLRHPHHVSHDRLLPGRDRLLRHWSSHVVAPASSRDRPARSAAGRGGAAVVAAAGRGHRRAGLLPARVRCLTAGRAPARPVRSPPTGPERSHTRRPRTEALTCPVGREAASASRSARSSSSIGASMARTHTVSIHPKSQSAR